MLPNQSEIPSYKSAGVLASYQSSLLYIGWSLIALILFSTAVKSAKQRPGQLTKPIARTHTTTIDGLLDGYSNAARQFGRSNTNP